MARDILADLPELLYYVDRVALLVRLTSGYGGTQLKDIQYDQQEYTESALNTRIQSIAPRVRARLDSMRGAVQ